MGIIVGAIEYMPGGHIRMNDENAPDRISLAEIELVRMRSFTDDPYLAPWARDLVRLFALFGLPGAERNLTPSRVLFVRNLPSGKAIYELFPGFLRRVVGDVGNGDMVLHRERIKRLNNALSPEDPILRVAQAFFEYYGIGRSSSSRRKINVVDWIPKVWADQDSNESIIEQIAAKYPEKGICSMKRVNDSIELSGSRGVIYGYLTELGIAVLKVEGGGESHV